mmetsp:Transcript_38949/g.76561  ORF Transcript_38949/g.76561 Transcript_38949/m.76561 type:complete len:692 (+) Transcript_38949:1065-3140(+)
MSSGESSQDAHATMHGSQGVSLRHEYGVDLRRGSRRHKSDVVREADFDLCNGIGVIKEDREELELLVGNDAADSEGGGEGLTPRGLGLGVGLGHLGAVALQLSGEDQVLVGGVEDVNEGGTQETDWNGSIASGEELELEGTSASPVVRELCSCVLLKDDRDSLRELSGRGWCAVASGVEGSGDTAGVIGDVTAGEVGNRIVCTVSVGSVGKEVGGSAVVSAGLAGDQVVVSCADVGVSLCTEGPHLVVCPSRSEALDGDLCEGGRDPVDKKLNLDGVCRVHGEDEVVSQGLKVGHNAVDAGSLRSDDGDSRHSLSAKSLLGRRPSHSHVAGRALLRGGEVEAKSDLLSLSRGSSCTREGQIACDFARSVVFLAHDLKVLDRAHGAGEAEEAVEGPVGLNLQNSNSEGRGEVQRGTVDLSGLISRGCRNESRGEEVCIGDADGSLSLVTEECGGVGFLDSHSDEAVNGLGLCVKAQGDLVVRSVKGGADDSGHGGAHRVGGDGAVDGSQEGNGLNEVDALGEADSCVEGCGGADIGINNGNDRRVHGAGAARTGGVVTERDGHSGVNCLGDANLLLLLLLLLLKEVPLLSEKSFLSLEETSEVEFVDIGSESVHLQISKSSQVLHVEEGREVLCGLCEVSKVDHSAHPSRLWHSCQCCKSNSDLRFHFRTKVVYVQRWATVARLVVLIIRGR